MRTTTPTTLNGAYPQERFQRYPGNAPTRHRIKMIKRIVPMLMPHSGSRKGECKRGQTPDMTTATYGLSFQTVTTLEAIHSMRRHLAEANELVKQFKEKVNIMADAVQTFVAALSTATTDIANDLNTIATNAAANGGTLSADDTAALAGAVTALQTVATQADSVATASGPPAATAAAAKAATPVVANANS
jgi:hypothetical protein